MRATESKSRHRTPGARFQRGVREQQVRGRAITFAYFSRLSSMPKKEAPAEAWIELDPSVFQSIPRHPFREAIRLLAGGKEPPAFVRGYGVTEDMTESEYEKLTIWLLNDGAALGWSTGIGIIEAAERIVAVAVENGNIPEREELERFPAATVDEYEPRTAEPSPGPAVSMGGHKRTSAAVDLEQKMDANLELIKSSIGRRLKKQKPLTIESAKLAGVEDDDEAQLDSGF